MKIHCLKMLIYNNFKYKNYIFWKNCNFIKCLILKINNLKEKGINLINSLV